jgi:hypothetical protein
VKGAALPIAARLAERRSFPELRGFAELRALPKGAALPNRPVSPY